MPRLPLLAYLLLAGCSLAPASPEHSEAPTPRLSAGATALRDDDRETFYQELTRLHPRAAEPWFQLGNLYAAQGRLEEAEHAYRQVLVRADRPEALHNLGLVQVRMGVAALGEARRRLPANDPVHAETRELLRLLLESAP